jgi:hypothetical protein
VTPIGDLVDRVRPYFARQPKVRPPAAAGQPAQPTPAAPAPASNAGPAATPAPQQPAAPAVDAGQLAKRREDLARELAELQWDLGGLTYEMAIRDHFRLDLLVRQAAQLQQVDAELGSIDRLMQLEQAGAAGSCPSCGALYSRGAVYCWQCGNDLMPKTGVQTPPAPPPARAPAPPAAQQPAPAAPPASQPQRAPTQPPSA